MWDDEVVRTFGAAADTILPGSTASGIHLRVIELFDAALEGYPVLVSGLLDAFAVEVEPAKKFADLDEASRSQVLRILISDESVDVRDIADGLLMFTLGQNYSESHPDHQQIWERIGYRGPIDGAADAISATGGGA